MLKFLLLTLVNILITNFNDQYNINSNFFYSFTKYGLVQVFFI